MKNLIIILLSVCAIAISCNLKKTDEDVALIEEIENSLLPRVIIESDSLECFSITERMKHFNVPGVSIAFINGGEIKWAKGYGYLTTDSIEHVDKNTLFQAASISKPVAAMAALHLVEEGKLDLDEDVNKYLSDWKVEENTNTVSEKVNLRRILSHSAGLTVHGFGGYSSTDTMPHIIQVLEGDSPANSQRIYPDTIPGTIYRYSGGGYTVMQKMLTDITGMTFPELMDRYVLEPTGMSNSTYKQPLPEELSGNTAAGHKPDGSMVPGKWHVYPEMAAAGLWTTPSDLLKYALEVQNSLEGESNKVISAKMTEEMLCPQMDSHGLGPAIGGEGDSLRFSHGGANEGYRCQLMAFAKLGQGVAIMTNSDNGGALMSEIMRSFSHVYGWSIYKPIHKTVIDIEKSELETLAGTYSFEWRGEEMIIEFTVADNHLKGKQLWDGFTFYIYPESEMKFFNPEDGAPFEFKANEKGELLSVTIQDQFQFVKQKLLNH